MGLPIPLAFGRMLYRYILGPPGVSVPFRKLDSAAGVVYWVHTARKIGTSMDLLARGLRGNGA
jgi:hypothetical protein